MITIDEKENRCIVHIEGEMTIYMAAQMQKSLATAMLNKRDIEMNLEAVTEIDTTGIQILMMVKREQTKNGLNFNLINFSDVVSDVINLYRLSSYFNNSDHLASA